MAVDATYYTQKKGNFFMVNIIFLICTILVTLGLFGVNFYIQSTNDKISSDITATDASLTALRNDKRIQIYDLVEANKSTLTKLGAHSQVSTFIHHIKSVGQMYGMSFQGFDYANGVVTTKAVFAADERGIAYTKLTKFISDYRSHAENIMQLLFINSVLGQDQIEVSTQFKVK